MIRCLEGLTTCVGFGDVLRITLPRALEHFDRFVVVTAPSDDETIQVCHDAGIEPVITRRFYETPQDRFNKGKGVNDGLATLSRSDWVLLCDCDIVFPPNFRDALNATRLDPSFIYGIPRIICETPQDWDAHCQASTTDIEPEPLIREASELVRDHNGWYPAGVVGPRSDIHHDEGGFRWCGPRAELRLKADRSHLRMHVMAEFSGARGWQTDRRQRVWIIVNGRIRQTIYLKAARPHAIVEATDLHSGDVLQLYSDFVSCPALHGSTDRRLLSFRLSINQFADTFLGLARPLGYTQLYHASSPHGHAGYNEEFPTHDDSDTDFVAPWEIEYRTAILDHLRVVHLGPTLANRMGRTTVCFPPPE